MSSFIERALDDFEIQYHLYVSLTKSIIDNYGMEGRSIGDRNGSGFCDRWSDQLYTLDNKNK